MELVVVTAPVLFIETKPLQKGYTEGLEDILRTCHMIVVQKYRIDIHRYQVGA